MSSTKQPKTSLRSRLEPPGSNSPRNRRTASSTSSGGVKKATSTRTVSSGGAKATSTRGNPLKDNALFQAIQGMPRTSPQPSQPAQPRPGQELRDRIAGKTPKPKPVAQEAPVQPAHPLAARFNQPALTKKQLDTKDAPSAPRRESSYERSSGYDRSSDRSSDRSYDRSRSGSYDKPSYDRSSYDKSSSDRSDRVGGYDKFGNYNTTGRYDRFGRSLDKYDARDRERYERARVESGQTKDGYKAPIGSGRSSNGSGNGSGNGRERYNARNSQAQSYQESRERYAEDRVRYNAAAQKQAEERAAAERAASERAAAERAAAERASRSSSTKAEATTLSANGTASYSIKHLAMPPIVQISNLDRGTTRDDLYKFFVELGEIRDCRVLTLGNQGAMGEITFEDPEAAKIAFSKFNGALADGRRLVVNIVKYNSIADQKPVEVSNAVHQWPGAGNLRSDGYLKK